MARRTDEKKNQLLLLIGAVILVISLWIVGSTLKQTKTDVGNINTYEDCVAAGYPVTLSYPSQCRTPDGRIFVDKEESMTPGGDAVVPR